MMHCNSGGIRRIAQTGTILLLGSALAACAGPYGRAQTVQEDAPSVTYKYTDDEGLVDATIKAETYCREYNAWPTNAGMRVDADGSGEVTFHCNQTRAETYAGTRQLPSDVTVDYTYRDERALIDATTQAQRHCASYGAEARSRTVGTTADGTRTVVFECVRAR